MVAVKSNQIGSGGSIERVRGVDLRTPVEELMSDRGSGRHQRVNISPSHVFFFEYVALFYFILIFTIGLG